MLRQQNATRIQSTRAREWCFTVNNPTEASKLSLDAKLEELCTFAIYQHERAPTTNTLHLQGYLCLLVPRTLIGIKRSIFHAPVNTTAHLEVARGTRDECVAYCSKEESRDIEFERKIIGRIEDVPAARGQGARNDIAASAAIIAAGGSIFSCAESDPATFVKYHKGLTALQSVLHSKPRVRLPDGLFERPRVLWYYGSTGSGKTRAVFEEIGTTEYFLKIPGSAWFDGYVGQSISIFDDFRANWFSYGLLLRLLDSYPLTVEVKGSSVHWSPKVIYITAPKRPEVMYHNLASQEDGAINQLLRRITEIKLFGDEPVVTQYAAIFNPPN